jgi:hypothetical protein
MGYTMNLRIALMLSMFVVCPFLIAQGIDEAAYQSCTTAATKPNGDPKEALAACAGPAAQGIPGAQYAMGALLLKTANGGVPPEATMWLEKAVASGHAGAAYMLALALTRGKDPANQERIRQLKTMAACGDYSQALADIKRAGITKEQLHCPSRVDADFTGEWSGALQWTKTSPAADHGPELKVVIAAGNAKVFMKRDSDWIEVKPGKFRMTQVEETAVITVIDEGSDFDGIWIEAWDIHLLRLNADEAVMSFLRTVNNRDMPAALSWRTFSTVAEGRVHRSSK